MIAGYDCLRDEGMAYAERMKTEGVDVELHAYQGMPHCFYGFVDNPKAIDYYERIVGFIKKYSG